MAEAQFADALASLVAREVAAGRGDHERLAGAMERLATALGMTVAVASKGDPRAIDTLMIGVEKHIHAEAVHKARVVRMMVGRPANG